MPRLARTLLALLFGLLALGVAAMAQERARRPSFLESQLESLMPGLQVEGLEGVWRAAPTAERITLSDSQGVWLTMRQVRLNLAPTALLRGVLRLELLEAALVRLERLPVAAPTGAAPAPPPPAQGGVLPSLPQLPLDLALDRLAVERLELAPAVAGQEAAFALQGRATLDAGRLAAALALRRLDAEGSAGIELALAPAEDRLAATVLVRESVGGLMPTLLGLPQHPLSLDLRLAGPASGADLLVQAGLGPEITLTARGTVRALASGAYGAALEGEARAAPLLPSPDHAALAFPARFAFDADRPAGGPLALRRLELDVPAGQAVVTGTLDLAREAPDLTLRLALREAARFGALLPPGLAWESVRAEARVSGTLSQPEVRLAVTPQGFSTGVAQADAVLGPSPTLAGWAALPGPRVDLALQGAEGRLALAGSLGDPLAATARLSLPRLAVLDAGSEGALEVEARAEGPRADPAVTLAARSGRIVAAGHRLEGFSLDARIEAPASAPQAVARLDARLDGQPIALALRGRPEDGKLRMEQAEARVATAVLSAAGLLDLEAMLFDGTARLEAPTLAPLGALAGLRELKGRASAQASFAPRNGIQGFDVTLEAPALAYAGLSGRLRAAAEGTPLALGWSIEAGAGPTIGRIAARGRLEAAADGARRLEIAALGAEAYGETIRLAAPARLVLAPDGGITLGRAAVAVAEGGRVQAEGRWGPERADLTITIAALPASLAGRFAPGVGPEGTLQGAVRVTGPVGQPELRADLRGSGLRARAPWAQGLPPLSLRAEAAMAAGGATQARVELAAGAAGQVVLTARLPRGFGAEAPLAAGLDGTLALAPLAGPFLAAGADRVQGRIALALRAEGTLGTPRLGGRATLSGVEYQNAAYGARISGIGGTITGQGTRLAIERLQGRTAGGGVIALQGGVDLGAPGLSADITLTARNARPVVSDLVTATFDADLRLTGPVLGEGTFGGRVRVQRAEIRVPDRLPASVPTLEPVRVRGTPPAGAILPPSARQAPGEGAPASSALPPIALDVTVSAPGQVFVRGRGLDAELGGEVRIGGTLAGPVPQGGLTLRRGTLDVLARRLTFDRGRIDFASGTLTPNLDLTARSQAGTTGITVTVRGTPAAPEIAFSSTPELPQDEILARLLFDRPTSRLSPFEIAQIAQAVAQLTGIGGGEGALDRVRGALGLDRLGLAGGAERSRGPAVEAGRYVAPGVFLGLRQGVQGGQTGVGVEVELTPRLKLEGQTATGPAGDRMGLTYEFEY